MSRILIVEDEESLGDTLRELLADAGHEVELAANGVDALAQAAARPPDVILLDLMLPLLDGVGFLRRLRADHIAPRARVIAMSSGSPEPLVDVAVDRFLAKPFRLDALLGVLDGESAA